MSGEQIWEDQQVKSYEDLRWELLTFFVLFADNKGNKNKKELVWLLKIDPSDLVYDPDFDDDGNPPILEQSILKATLASRSKLELVNVY